MIKSTLLLLAGVAVGLAAGLFFGIFQMDRPEQVIREPERPGEARIEYTPPDPPKVPIQLITEGLPMLRSMLEPEVHRVTEDVYLATGYALGNVGLVITREGLVIVDTTESPEAAREVRTAFRAITDKPVHTVVYTHFHPDHTQGTSAFAEPGARVIATRAFEEWIGYQNELLKSHHLRARATQAGAASKPHAFPLPVERNPFRAIGESHEVVPPTLTFDETHSFTLGGKRFELFATSGETPDHLALWLPGERVLFSGDLFYASFPNLSTPMLEPRPIRGWIRSLERFLDLGPEHLLPGHTGPLSGAETIRKVLTDYRDAIRHVHDATVRSINRAESVDEAVATIDLPPRLKGLPYLDEVYGRVAWAVRGIWRGYTGWYDGSGTGLHPLPPGFRARELIQLAGGADQVLTRAIDLQAKNEHQLCAELCDTVLAANPGDRLARRVKAASLRALAFSYKNLNAFGFYRSAYSLEMQASSVERPTAP